MTNWKEKWKSFQQNEPYKQPPFNKRNWGAGNHSLCSFYGKLKPAISHHLIKTFTDEGSSILDPFCGSGTISFEGAMNKRKTYSLDINPISIVLTSAKVKNINIDKVYKNLYHLSQHIENSVIDEAILKRAQSFGFNKKLVDYFEEKTFSEILKARNYFASAEKTPEHYFILACLIHILHGNRPYALSRNSHPITPYAPTGEFIYKNLISKLVDKLNKSLTDLTNYTITEGEVFHGDILDTWDYSINNINAILTSPPFFDSTKYYLINWIRSWFLGWEFEDFEKEKMKFIDTIQKKSMSVYDDILRQAKDRLTSDGVVVFHLGKSHKKDMGEEISKYAKRYFNSVEIYNEDVSHVEKHGIEDKGSVNIHQYLVMH
jgi:methylase of polypeptide subunit release factors